MSQEKVQIKIITLTMKRFLMNNPDNEAWIKAKSGEVTRSKQRKLGVSCVSETLCIQNCQLSMLVHVATHSHMMDDVSEQCWWK
jgi:hypothetical protein